MRIRIKRNLTEALLKTKSALDSHQSPVKLLRKKSRIKKSRTKKSSKKKSSKKKCCPRHQSLWLSGKCTNRSK